MKTRTVVVLVVAGAAAITAAGLWRRPLSVDTTESGATETVASETAEPAIASPSPTSASTANAPAEQRAIDAAWRAPSTPSPRYAEPEEIERQLAQFIAEQPGLSVVSLSSIDCGATRCEIALTGSDPNPRYTNAYSDLFRNLPRRGRNEFFIRTAGIGTREIAPGAREYVISFDYQPLVDLSADALIAARQYAACAAFWRRMTENPAPDDIVRGYLDSAEHYVTLASSVLGEQEAARVAAETRGGPVLRDCVVPPH